MRQIIKKHPYLFWWGLDIIICILTVWYVVTHDAPQSIILTFLIIAAGYISVAGVVLVPIIITVCKAVKKRSEHLRKKRELAEYRAKYVSEFPYCNSYFGNSVFEYNSLTGMYTLISCDEVPFKEYDGYSFNIGICGNKETVDEVFVHLTDTFENAQYILEEFYAEIKQICDEWGEEDEYGAPLGIDFIRGHFVLCDVLAEKPEPCDDITICLTGALLSDVNGDDNFLGEHLLTYLINCRTGEKLFQLVG